MTEEEAQAYYDNLTDAEAKRYNSLVLIGLQLGKPIEGAYSYAKVIMEEDKNEG